MLYVGNHPFTPSADGKIITFLVCPAYGQHVSCTCLVDILRHCPIHFHYCPFPAAHYHTITGQKWFCVCALGTLSARPQAITIQTDQVMPGYRLLSSSSGGPSLGPPFLFDFFCFVFIHFLFIFTLINKFLTTPIFWIEAFRGPASG